MKKNYNKYLFLVFAILVMSLFLSGCSKETYQESSFKNLETMTSVTGTELHSTEDRLTEIRYNYLISSDVADNDIKKYAEYLQSNYGLLVKEKQSGRIYYEKDNLELWTSSLAQESGSILFTINLPTAPELLEEKQKVWYENITSLIADNKYNEAIEQLSFGDGTYADTRQLKNYCKGMYCYYDLKCYGAAIDFFKKAEGVLDSAKKIEEIQNLFEEFEGVYYTSHTTVLGKFQYFPSYAILEDGTIRFADEQEYKRGNIGNAFKYDITNLAELSDLDGFDVWWLTNECYGTNELKFEDYDYAFMFDGDRLIVGNNSESDSLDALIFEGVYEKIK